ncbi:MAG: glycosyltransferase [Kocuria sp.]|nr:glycosyltransferase [Kocuria sp.]MDO5619153.1 glycosyltransferase [Kocuria sp.]
MTIYGQFISGQLADDQMLADTLAFAQAWRPDMIIWDALTYTGPVVAQTLNLPHVRTLFGPDYFAAMVESHQRHGLTQENPLSRWLRSRFAPGVEVPDGEGAFHELLFGMATIDPLPPPLARRVNHGLHLPCRFIPMNACGVIDTDWLLSSKRPVVCVTLGYSSRAYGLPSPHLQAILTGLSRLDIDVVATLNADQLQGIHIPGNVHVYEYLPLDLILRHCAVVISHFGINTLGTVVKHGLPQLYVGDGLDMWGGSRVAEDMVATGAALAVHAQDLTASAIEDRVNTLLTNPSHRAAAHRLQEHLERIPPPHSLVPKLERMIELPHLH